MPNDELQHLTAVSLKLTKMDVKLDTLIRDVEQLQSDQYGDGNHDGIRIDVDRLKRSRANQNAVLWVLFTSVVGMAAAFALDFLNKN